MKKLLVFAVVLALLVPAAAFAKAEFSLGGFIKMDTFWDSTQGNVFILPGARNNAGTATGANFNHGRWNWRANETRFNFTIKGPKVWGAQTTGFIEMDFDGGTRGGFQGYDTDNNSTSNSLQPRLRHAMFRLNWPETELMFGQYWGLMSSWWVETAEDGPFMATGTALERLPQIRVTQKFLGDWSVAGLVGLPNNTTLTTTNPYGGGNNGQCSETPQFQGSVKYAHDWWGKAAYYGHPIPFTAQVMAGWQRSISRADAAWNYRTFDFNNYIFTGAGNAISNQQYVNPWIVMGTLFIPVIPTHTANLAGTASILTQWWIGQGVEAFGILGGNSNILQYNHNIGNQNLWTFTHRLMNRFGGMVEGQYFFTNQWYLNVAYGITKNYGVNTSSDRITAADYFGQDFIQADQFKWFQQVDATLWYRPIQALKFGLQYSYAQTNYFQVTPSGTGNVADTSDTGNEHRVEFVGYFFF